MYGKSIFGLFLSQRKLFLECTRKVFEAARFDIEKCLAILKG